MAFTSGHMEKELQEACIYCHFLDGDDKVRNNMLYPSYRQDFGPTSILGENSTFERNFSIWPQGNTRSYLMLPGISSISSADYIDSVCPKWLSDELKRLFPEAMAPPPPPPCIFTDTELNYMLKSQQRKNPSYFTNYGKECYFERQPLNIQDNQQVRSKKATTLFHVALMDKDSIHTQSQNITSPEKTLLTEHASSQNLFASPMSRNGELFQDFRESHNTQIPWIQDHANGNILRKSQMSENAYIFPNLNTDSNKNFSWPEMRSSGSKNEDKNEVHLSGDNLDEISKNDSDEYLSLMNILTNDLNSQVEDLCITSSDSMSSEKNSPVDDLKHGKFANKKRKENQKLDDNIAGAAAVENVSTEMEYSFSESDVMANISGASSLTIKPKEQSGLQQQRCSFCAKNGEMEAIVRSHNLHHPETNLVQCPILRAYKCESCHATGDFAHTRSYCPRVRMLEGKVQSATIALKSTRHQANGTVRNVSKKGDFKSSSKYTISKF